jgi:nucleotide sugar dehydrogenase
VNPGDCDRLSLKLGNRATLIYNPEFIAQGTIIRDLRQAEIVLVGVDIDGNEASPVQQLEEVYNRIQGLDSNLRVMSRKAAEITKIAINSFLTNKIAFANIVGDILVSSGQEEFIEEVLDTIGEDSRIGKKYLKYGFGFGGPCLPRDNRAFANFSKILNINYEIGIVVDAMNSQHAGFLLELHERKNINNLPYFFDSIAYKLGTDILVESQQYRLFVDLLNRGRRVFLRADSRIELQIKSQLEKKHLELIRLVQSIEEVDCEVFPVLFN